VIIHTNTNAAVATAALVGGERRLDVAVKHLSTGSRIYSASDDASGLAISTRLTSQIRELDMSIAAAADAIGMVSIIDGALEEVGNMYQRLRELALQASTGTNSEADVRMLQKEFDQIVLGIESIITNTTYQNLNVFFNPDGVVPGATGWRNDGQAVVMDLNFNLGSAGSISTTFTRTHRLTHLPTPKCSPAGVISSTCKATRTVIWAHSGANRPAVCIQITF
jgi:flagellin